MSAAHAFVDERGYLCHRCPFCGGPSHPATGCVYAPGYVACYRCTLEAWAWVRRHTDGAGRKRGAALL